MAAASEGQLVTVWVVAHGDNEENAIDVDVERDGFVRLVITIEKSVFVIAIKF